MVVNHIDAIAAHRPYGMNCKCGRDINSDEDWARHLVEEVFTEEWGVTIDDAYAPDPHDFADSEAHARKLAQQRCQSCDRCYGAMPKGVVSRLVTPWVKEES